MIQLNTPNLDQALGSYLHQDWLDGFKSDEAALRAVVKSESVERVTKAIKEIDDVLAASLPEEDLKDLVMHQMGCYFNPKAIGLTYEAWLKRARGILKEAGSS